MRAHKDIFMATKANPLDKTTALPAAINWRAALDIIVTLFKLRVVSLLLLAAVGGAFLGTGGWPGWGSLLPLIIAGGMAASGASALNQYLERQTDGLMRRTQQRPLVVGAVRPAAALSAGIALILLPVLAAALFRPALAFFLLLGALIYVGVYTIWLKKRTLLNIVIGGAAGSAAVMSGGAAVGAWQEPGVIVLALLVFLWTPSHFWSLAILYQRDYRRADVPMLPARSSPQQAALWILLHSAATGWAALLLGALPSLGLLYLLPVGAATIDLFARNFRLLHRPTPAHARSFFIGSNIYLTVVLVAICLATSVNW